VDAVTALDVSARRIVIGTWGCAVIVMVASAINAVLTFSSVGDNRVLGLATGIAVDIALCVGLIGDRLLARYGLSSAWGRALRILAAVMAVVLQVGAAVKEHHYFVALLHAFLPALLVALTEYGQDVLIKVTDLSPTSQRDADQGRTLSTSLPLQGSQTTTASQPPVMGDSWAPATPASTSRQTPVSPASTASYATVTSRPPASPGSPGTTTVPTPPAKPRLVPTAPPVPRRKPAGDDTQVLALLAQGKGAEEVASALGCSKRTAFRRMAAVKKVNEAKAAAS
jgi:hypothetical protein